MTTLSVRPATFEDLDGVVASSFALLTEDAAARDREVDPKWALRQGRESFARVIADPSSLLLVAATEDGQVAGYLVGILAEPVDVLPIRSAALRALYVAPDHRGGGTGARLTATFLDWARRHDAVRAEVNAYVANEAGLRFYQREGFTPRALRLDLDLTPPPQ